MIIFARHIASTFRINISSQVKSNSIGSAVSPNTINKQNLPSRIYSLSNIKNSLGKPQTDFIRTLFATNSFDAIMSSRSMRRSNSYSANSINKLKPQHRAMYHKSLALTALYSENTYGHFHKVAKITSHTIGS